MASIKLLEKARHGLKVENFAPLILTIPICSAEINLEHFKS